MKTFLMFGKSSAEELKEISFKYKAEILSIVKSFGGDIKSMDVMLREKYLVVILTFPGIKRGMKASIALSKLTGIPFATWPAVPIEELRMI